MDEADLRRQIEDRDAIIASLQARIDQLTVSWTEIFEAGRRSMLPGVPRQERRRDATRLRVIRGGLGAAAAAAALRAALRAARSHPLVSAPAALTAAGVTAAALVLTLPAGPPVTAQVPAPPARRGPVPSSPSPSRHPGRYRIRRQSAARQPAPSGTASPYAPPSRVPQAHGTPSPVQSPVQSPAPSSRSPSPSPASLPSVTVTVTVPAPSHCLVEILGLCI